MAPSPKKMVAPTSWAGVTTIMFRNIPSRYTQQSLLTEIRSEGFYPDYFYLPMDFKKNANAGYAFLNFAEEKEVAAFHARFDGARLSIRSAKFLQVVPAALQGYEANYAHMQHSAVLNHHRSEHGPLFMRESADTAAQAAQVGGQSGMYVLRDLPQMYTHELMALELLHHGCGLGVAFLDVPIDPKTRLNQGYALVRFSDAASAQHAERTLQGAGFSLAPAALPMTIAPMELPGKARAFAYSTPSPAPEPAAEVPEVDESAPHELERMLQELMQMQEKLQAPLPRAGRFAGLDIAVDEVRIPAKFQAPTASTACSDSSPTSLEETPVKRRVGAITPPTRSTSCSQCSSAGSSPRLPLTEAPYAPYSPFTLPCLLPSPSSCRAMMQGC